MDNFRRFLFTKDEVKQLGTELTALTSEPIKVLYIPLWNGVTGSYPLKEGLYFNYWSASSDTAYSGSITSNSYTSTIQTTSQVWIGGTGCLRFGWKLNNNVRNYYLDVHSFRAYTDNYTSGSQKLYVEEYIYNHLIDDDDVYYVRVDITKVKLVVYRGSFSGEFFLKYESGTISPDTIFYEPGTYE